MTNLSSTHRLIAITATTDFTKAWPRLQSWGSATPIVVVLNGGASAPTDLPRNVTLIRQEEYLGTVPAFRVGVDWVLANLPHAEVLACLHDDVILKDPEWDSRVLRFFDRTPHCGLAGFGGAIGIGDLDIYQKPYKPVQLARVGFRSNLDDAEVHGLRSLLTEPVACLDGFSQIGRRAFFDGYIRGEGAADGRPVTQQSDLRPWTYIEHLGVIHHAYDGILGCVAARYGWSVFYLPIRAWHLGGQTAVGDSGYSEWAKGQIPGGDAGFWEHAHKVWYDTFTDVLPLRV